MADHGDVEDREKNLPLGLTDLPSHNLFLLPPPPELFHYTNLDGASGIIQSKSLHLTKFTYLNDRSELVHAIDQFRFAAQSRATATINDAHRQLLTDVAHQLSSFRHTNICVASFCENPDLLSQWRAYGHAGRGVALGFSGPILAEINNHGWATLFRCVYKLAHQGRIIGELIDMLLQSFDLVTEGQEEEIRNQNRRQIIGYFNTTFLRVAPVLKHPAFEEEQEWRIVTAPRQTTDPKFQATVSSGRLSEYYVYNFTSNEEGEYEFLRTIWIGPSDGREAMSDALFLLCMRNHIRSKATSFSQIPYRG